MCQNINNPLPLPFFYLDGITHPAFHVYAFGVADYNLVKANQADAKVHSLPIKQDNTLSDMQYVRDVTTCARKTAIGTSPISPMSFNIFC